MLDRIICRVRGHAQMRQTLRLGDDAREVRLCCRRCDVTLGHVTDPLLLTLLLPGGLPLRCYASGQTGTCGHPLAECEGGMCGGVFCPTCGQWRCENCEGFASAFQAAADKAAARMDEALGVGEET
jgi:hypothetical protein